MKKKKILSILLILFCVTAFAQLFTLHIATSPDETNGAIKLYLASWRATNSASSNNWSIFYRVPLGVTNITIPSIVPSPSFIRVQALGTNNVASVNTNYSLYDTNILWPLITNSINPPQAPAGFVITNN